MTTRRHLLAAAAGLAATGAGRAQGSAFPDRAIKLVVPNPPGGPSDIVGRFLAEGMRGDLGQALVIDNRAGASGLIGTAAVATAVPDGYTVLVTSRTNHVIAPLVQRGTAQVDPVRDLQSVGLALRAIGMLVTSRQSGIQSLKELIAQAKAQPGRLNFGSAGIGATNHIALEQLKALAGVDLLHVPYKGSGPLVTGLMGGEVQLALLDFSSAQAGIKAGSIVPLAQTAARRHVTLPELPTLAEAGFRNFDPSFWIGLAVPRATPPAVVARLNKALNRALDDTQMRARAQVNGWELAGGAPKVMDDLLAQDMAGYPALLRRLDIKAG